MAQIPVEERRGRSGGGGWWKWLIALLVVGLLVWFVASIVDTGPEDDMAALDQEDRVGTLEDEAYREDPTTAPGQQGQRPDGPVTDLATLENGTSPRQMEGSDVRLTDVRVTQVINDRAVIVESAGTNGRQSPEVGSEATRPEDSQSGQVAEGQTGMQQGQMTHSALVLLDDGAQGTDRVTEGQRIRTLSGTVRMADASTMQERDIQSQEAMDDGYFIQADRLEIAASS